MLRILLVLALVCSCISLSYAQEEDSIPFETERAVEKNKFTGIGIGMVLPKTDLAPTYQKPGSNYSASFHFNKRKRLNLSLFLNIGKVQSEDREVAYLDQSEFQINSYASTVYQSLHVEPTFNLVKKENWAIFIAQGFGFFSFRVYDQHHNDLSDQLNSRAPGESVSNFAVILPTSLGAYYFLPNDFGFHAKISLWNTQTDYLDNISSFGNPDNNDNILNFQLSVVKRFSKVIK
ncbi:hypothetical protein JKA74_01770 [Marivirga sp. S37H4]|uniref:Outer membrane protein beta-barrel domain-containing protein n=1 Tax=Marivirga aurantiaca TaxID=2802615 RepID=A0A934WVE0_9BACT|nr:hypothetical protein [Marivirga aurantiaca]MBK6263748.1 hypothetical protein [Marivirga aurantiaca]